MGITINGGAVGAENLSIAKGSTVTFVDTGAPAVSLTWSFAADTSDDDAANIANGAPPGFPSSLSAAPTITNATSTTATYVADTSGMFTVKLTRVESFGTTRQYATFAVPEAGGAVVPHAGANNQNFRSTAEAKRRGWALPLEGAMRAAVNSSVVTFGSAHGDGVRVVDGAITSGSAALACATSTPWTIADVGKKIVVYGAGPLVGGINSPLVTTIASFTNSGHVTLSATATATVSGAIVIFGTDCAAALQAAVNATAAAGVALLIPPGRYVVGSTLSMPSSLHIVGTALTIISGALVQTGAETANIFETPKPNPSATSTLTAAVPRGARQFTVTGNIVTQGAIVRLHSVPPEGNNIQLRYDAVLVTGTGPYTVTVERPIQFPFTVNTIVEVMPSWPLDIQVDGNGMIFDGSADSPIHLWNASHCRVVDLIISGQFANWAIVPDSGGERNVLRNIKVTGSTGIGLACNEGTVIERCDVVSSTSHGFWLWDGVDCTLLDCRANYCASQGVNVSTNGVSNHGPLRQRIVGGNFDSNVAGIVLTSPAEGFVIDGASVKYNKYYGIGNVDANTLGHQAIDIVNCDIGPGTAGDGGAIQANGIGYSLPAIYATAGARIRMRGGRIIADGPASTGSAINQGGVVANDANTVVELIGVDVQTDALSAGVPNFLCFNAGDSGSVISLDNVRVRGTIVGLGNVYGFVTGPSSGTGTFRIGRVDIDGIASGNRYFGTGYFSRTATFVATGSTPKDVTWPNIKSTDRVSFRRTTSGGTVSTHAPTYTITEGVKFTVTFDASDTSTYEYRVE